MQHIGTSSVARGLSSYIDALCDHKMEKFFTETMPINVDFLGKYPDWLSFFVILLLAVLLSAGAKESTFLNNIFTSVNLLTIIIVIISGAINGNNLKLLTNWNLSKPFFCFFL